jgi:hypothetical protein
MTVAVADAVVMVMNEELGAVVLREWSAGGDGGRLRGMETRRLGISFGDHCPGAVSAVRDMNVLSHR